MSTVSAQVARQVGERARFRCEYCHTPQVITGQTFHVEHILPKAHGGQSNLDNLCLACPRCNLHKQDLITAVDPRTHRRIRLFNPRQDEWDEHFRWSANITRIIGRTAIGRVTVMQLAFNAPTIMFARQMWRLLRLLP